MAYPDDSARVNAVLSESTANKDNIFNVFMFGSLKSLKGERAAELAKKKTVIKKETKTEESEESEDS